MKNEISQKYNMLTAGKILRSRRLEMGKSIQQVSIETKIQAKYIEQIELDEYEKFDSDVFLSGYIKIYAAHLSLDVEKVLALYRRASSQVFSKKHTAKDSKSTFDRIKTFDFGRFATPRNMIALLLTLIIVAILGYLSLQFYNFQKNPLLEVSSPINNLTVTDSKLEIVGKSEANTSVQINGQTIILEENFSFNETLILKEGSNTITVKAIKDNNTSQETSIILNVEYEPQIITPPAPEDIPTEPIGPILFQFNVTDEPAWIQVTIDGRQEFAQILNGGFTAEFEVLESLFISTGKPNGTEIFINGEQRQFNLTEEGTGSFGCEVQDGELICE